MISLGNYVILVYLQLFLWCDYGIFATLDMYEGDACLWKGKVGVCAVLSECESLAKDLRERKISPYDLEKCAFKDQLIVVCCPDKVPNATTSTNTQPGSNENKKNTDFYFPNGNVGNRNQEQTTIANKIIEPTAPTTDPQNKRPAEIACDEIKKNFNILGIDQKIIEGKNAEPGEFPHMVALGYGMTEPQWMCAGTLISDRYVLTAGHCAQTRSRLPVWARLGRNNIAQVDSNDLTPLDVRIENITLHKNYRISRSYNDIALIRLAEPVEFTRTLHPACLHTSNEPLIENMNLTITGWGTKDVRTRASSDYLQKANVQPVSRDKCSTYPAFKGNNLSLPNGIIESQLCAVDDKSDTCQGDSGGPIQIKEETSAVSTIVGITSFGISCGTNIPGVYTRVSSYLDWIENIVWKN